MAQTENLSSIKTEVNASLSWASLRSVKNLYYQVTVCIWLIGISNPWTPGQLENVLSDDAMASDMDIRCSTAELGHNSQWGKVNRWVFLEVG